MKNSSIKQAAIYYHAPEQKINDAQVVRKIKNIQDLCRQLDWKPVQTFVDKSASGSMLDTMRAYVSDLRNHITITVCYTAGDCLVGLGNKDNSQSSEGHAGNTDNSKFTGGVPYGYTMDGGVLVVDPNRAAVVIEIFKVKAGGASLQCIADTLNNKGIKSSRGGEWNKAAISFILKNPAYTGQYRYNGNTIRIPAIIDSQLYHKANT